MNYAKKTAAAKGQMQKKLPLSTEKDKPQMQPELQNFIKDLEQRNRKNVSGKGAGAGDQSQQHVGLTKVRRPPLRKGQPLSRLPELSKNLSKLSIEEESAEQKKKRLQVMIQKFECPFTWRPLYKRFTVETKEYVVNKVQVKDAEVVDEKKFKWRNFVCKLVISYELFVKKQLEEAMKTVTELENILIQNEENVEWLFMGIKDALWHVVMTCKAFLYLEQNLLKEAEKTACEIQSIKTMKQAAMAGIYGIMAAVYMEYGHEGNMRALEVAKRALEMDPTCAEWHFLVGKCMGRIRRVANCHDKVDPFENRCLNKASSMDQKNALYKVYLAQQIRERVFRQYKKEYPNIRSEERNKLEKAFRASLYTYLEAKELQPNCPHILTRCGYGIMKLPLQYVDLKTVRECLDKAIELAPRNAMAHHVKGLYLERFDVEAEEALAEIKIAAQLGNFGAAMDLIRMRYHLNIGDVIKELEEVAALYVEPHYVQIANTQIGSYLLFIKFDLVLAVKYFLKVVDMDSDSYHMKSHKSLFLRMKDPVNMFQVLLEELDKNTNWKSFSPEQAKVLKRFRIKILKHDTLETQENRLTVHKLLLMSRDQLDKDRFKKNKLERQKDQFWRGDHKFKRKFKQNKSAQVKKICVENNNDTKPEVPKPRISRRDSKLKHSKQSKTSKDNQRSYSISSVSSVDSDYQRSDLIHGPRGFFLSDESKETNTPKTDETLDNASILGRYSENLSQIRMNRSRDSSICSISSFEDMELLPDDFEAQKEEENCTDIELTNNTDGRLNELKLTVENLKLFDQPISCRPNMGTMMDLAGSSGRRTTERSRTSSVSSQDLTAAESLLLRRGSEGSHNALCKSSVMDRVKQSYTMLNRTNSVTDQNNGGNLMRSESFTNLNKRGMKKKGNLPRSDSTQSLNVEVGSLSSRFKKLNLQSISGSANSFMPSFCTKGKEDK